MSRSQRRKAERRNTRIATACGYACAYIGLATALALVSINAFI